MAKLFLFDVDWTLIDTSGAGSRALSLAFKELYGIDDAFAGIAFTGRTDASIVAEAFSLHGIGYNDHPQAAAQFREMYFRFLEDMLADNSRGRVLAGVDRLLGLLSRWPQIGLGLATGNFRHSAFMKLERYGLAGYFADGGFGDDSVDRSEVVAIGIQRLEKRLGHSFHRQDIYVVGDTPHDIASGQANGVATVAVATGRTSLKQLAASQPTHLFPDLSDAEAFVRTVLGPE